MQPASLATFAADLTQLRQALANADPLAAPAEADSVAAAADAADALAAAFTGASAEERDHFLLRALDDAIAGIEIAAHLADALHGPAIPPDAAPALAAPLRDAYRAFAGSQPAYQALYHYRNALAAHLQLDTRPVPDGATAAPAAGKAVSVELPQDSAPKARRTRKPASS